MKMTKRFISLLTALFMLLSLSGITASASSDVVYDDYITEVTYPYGISPMGADYPPRNNIWNLVNGDYTGYVTSCVYRVYTNYWFTGKSTITVCVDDTNSAIASWFNSTSVYPHVCYITIIEKGLLFGGTEVGSETFYHMSYNGNLTATFTGLDPNKDYCIVFTKFQDNVDVGPFEICVS
jgi:hypothetical protein